MRNLVIAAALAGALVRPAQALTETEYYRLTFNNMSQEASECVAFFQVLSAALNNSGQQEGAADYQKASANTLRWALMLGAEAGILKETVMARVRMAAKDQMVRIDHNFANISILFEAYLPLCIEVNNGDPKRGEYWTKKNRHRLDRQGEK